ncbi:hypothetical protein CL614_08655 [archaeon]|nr:hypothetical protein [archaeon]|tara:strand:+ start:2447 stop:3349 length:903 start_codon:yes stop_codon:yes gene_type:complete
MKKLITILLIVSSSVGFSQSKDYVKSDTNTNSILYEKFKSYRDSMGCKIELRKDAIASDFLFTKALPQSKRHRISHSNDPTNAWERAKRNALIVANTNSEENWKNRGSNEIISGVPIMKSYSDTTNIDDYFEGYINEYISSIKFHQRVLKGFQGSPSHNGAILYEEEIDTLYEIPNNYKKYVSISTAVDLTNYIENKHVRHLDPIQISYTRTYIAVTICVFTYLRDDNIQREYPFIFTQTDESGEEFDITWLWYKKGFKISKLSGKIFELGSNKRIRNMKKYIDNNYCFYPTDLQSYLPD